MRRRSFFDSIAPGVAISVPGRDLRNIVSFSCGVCEADLSVCYHEERFTVPCSVCGSKFDVLWTQGAVGITLLEVGSNSDGS